MDIRYNIGLDVHKKTIIGDWVKDARGQVHQEAKSEPGDANWTAGWKLFRNPGQWPWKQRFLPAGSTFMLPMLSW